MVEWGTKPNITHGLLFAAMITCRVVPCSRLIPIAACMAAQRHNITCMLRNVFMQARTAHPYGLLLVFIYSFRIKLYRESRFLKYQPSNWVHIFVPQHDSSMVRLSPLTGLKIWHTGRVYLIQEGACERTENNRTGVTVWVFMPRLNNAI